MSESNETELLRTELKVARDQAHAANVELGELRVRADQLEQELVTARADFAEENDHIAEAQQALVAAGVQPGADGSVVLGIQRLTEERDAALTGVRDLAEGHADADIRLSSLRAEVQRLTEERDALKKHDWRRIANEQQRRALNAETALSSLRGVLGEVREQVEANENDPEAVLANIGRIVHAAAPTPPAKAETPRSALSFVIACLSLPDTEALSRLRKAAPILRFAAMLAADAERPPVSSEGYELPAEVADQVLNADPTVRHDGPPVVVTLSFCLKTMGCRREQDHGGPCTPPEQVAKGGA